MDKNKKVETLVDEVHGLSQKFKTPERSKPNKATVQTLLKKERAFLKKVLKFTSTAAGLAVLVAVLGKNQRMRASVKNILAQTAAIFPDIRASVSQLARRRLPQKVHAWFPGPEDIAKIEEEAPKRWSRPGYTYTGFYKWWFTHPEYWPGIFPIALPLKWAFKKIYSRQ